MAGGINERLKAASVASRATVKDMTEEIGASAYVVAHPKNGGDFLAGVASTVLLSTALPVEVIKAGAQGYVKASGN